MLLTLAWRNLWRQKRRTILTASALALALFLSLSMRSLQEGTYQNSIDNSARLSTGLIQLQHPEFGESNSIDDLVPGTEEFIAPIKDDEAITNLLPRIESFALAAAKDKSKGIMVVGVEPNLEDQYSNLGKKVAQGKYLEAGKQQVLVGESLARYMQLSVGDELVLYGQGYRGQTAAGLFIVSGIISLPIPQLESQLVYIPIDQAQIMFSTGDGVTSWVLHIEPLSQLSTKLSELQILYGEDTRVRDWTDLSPETAQNIQMDKAGGIFMMLVLYGVVGFGLFATILMMTLERQREFGVMLATGLLRSRLLTLIGIESVLIGLLGSVMGMILATPVLVYFHFNPIELTGETATLMLEAGMEPVLPFALSGTLYLNQAAIVLGLLLLCLIYPLIRVYKLNLVSALKGGAHAD
ncbi:putative ABC-type antimicrobial peptide transport system, permease component [Vibrio nigripulchritudo SFn27]|uniref:Putative ABC-type antimicrobial peptide transport system, permease component n=1 Tax=Vibrio nigripulchritudo TaxID=28173 RepID=U4K4E9_9VIBR|nr:ABC transporter permease [Vibrio nigripulchritudo]CCN85728.1 putative ABC-type antimicrobial peptide transport system, permease component [Vibrio nigripulchritudo BLFn1]CCN86706.1 putative ABC-type antimicrobial peptide transport system, permease component [Vibrio nigripulchritudo SFn27]CCN95992.1 putative ABC-type antimicrobial peptide transport system, permease component [Vibrio nigripulchritudo ENn2]CCO43323.1 putative ABC-type antimicrobial peptide transport system, permease component [V